MTAISWILTIIALAGAFLNAYQRRLCWPVWCCSNLGFILVNLSRGMWPEVLLFSGFLLSSVIGWRRSE